MIYERPLCDIFGNSACLLLAARASAFGGTIPTQSTRPMEKAVSAHRVAAYKFGCACADPEGGGFPDPPGILAKMWLSGS